MLHEGRADYAQLLTMLFLLINGPGRWSLDAVLGKARKEDSAQEVTSFRRKESANASVIV